jgi:hypothetical protein
MYFENYSTATRRPVNWKAGVDRYCLFQWNVAVPLPFYYSRYYLLNTISFCYSTEVTVTFILDIR